jgi:DNA repair protein RAD57
MTDLLAVLPEFCTKPFSNLLPSLERAQITVADVLTSDAVDLAKRAQLPAREIRRLTDALINALHVQLGVAQPVRMLRVKWFARKMVTQKQTPVVCEH